MWKQLGALLRKARDESGLSVRQIERLSGVSFRTLYAYENAENNGAIDLKKLSALCSVIGCDLAALLAEAMMDNGGKDDGEANSAADFEGCAQ